MVNALSFDLEHWHSATLLSDQVDDPTDHVEESVAVVLDLLARHDVEATFFVVGELAANYPDLVRRIDDAGHEIGSHGHTHTPLFDLTPAAFEQELRQSAAAIRRATGTDPAGFRAPNFSITRATAWAFDVLEASEYSYDSSVFPVKTPMYGVSGAPVYPYVATAADPFHAGTVRADEGVVEVPLAVVGDRFRLPIAGGFYGRLLPVQVLERGIDRLERRGIPATLYFHPWEFNPDVRIESPPLHKRFVSFHGIEKTGAKLDRLLRGFDWGPVRDVVERVERDQATRLRRRQPSP